VIIYGIICLIFRSYSILIYNTAFITTHFNFRAFQTFSRYILAFNYTDFLNLDVVTQIYVHLNILFDI